MLACPAAAPGRRSASAAAVRHRWAPSSGRAAGSAAWRCGLKWLGRFRAARNWSGIATLEEMGSLDWESEKERFLCWLIEGLRALCLQGLTMKRERLGSGLGEGRRGYDERV